MAPRKTKTEAGNATAKAGSLAYVTNLNDLPRREGGVRETPLWLTGAPKGAFFTPKWCVANGLYKSASAASAALMRNSRTLLNDDGKPEASDNTDGLLEQVARGTYRKV